MTRRQKRFGLVFVILLIAGAAIAMTLTALSQSVAYFYTPTTLTQENVGAGQTIRLGGLVKTDSVAYGDQTVAEKSVIVDFVVTDGDYEVPVRFEGILPDLFREGQGVVAQGALGGDGTFVATNVLAKHDENYMPKELTDALKEQGRWKDGDAY